VWVFAKPNELESIGGHFSSKEILGAKD